MKWFQSQCSKVAWLLASLFFPAHMTMADQFHYNNVLLGERAQGMGGAYCGVSDDASGVYYNPAGIAFALSNDVSGSANAFYERKITFKKAVFGEDFVEKSKGTVAPFVGGLGKLDNLVSGLTFAFGIYSTDSELKDQDDTQYSGGARFHRTANVRSSSMHVGVALAKRFGSKFSAGFGLGFVDIDELAQIYQDVFNTTSSKNYYYHLSQNVRDHVAANAIEPSLGIQLAIVPQLSWGVMLRAPVPVYQRWRRGIDSSVMYFNSTTGKVTDPSDTDIPEESRAKPMNNRDTETIEKPFGDNNSFGVLPIEARTGLAWFASTRMLSTFDLIYHTAAEEGNVLYEREAVLDYALGMEYFLTPTYPLRLGVFTNNDARPEPKAGSVGQNEHIDYLGASAFIAMVQPNSQLGIGGMYQVASGKSIKNAGSAEVIDVEGFAYSLGFTVSHNF